MQIQLKLTLMAMRTRNKGRHGVWNMIYFGIFRTVFPIVVPDQKSISKAELNVKRFLLGCICGTLGMLHLVVGRHMPR